MLTSANQFEAELKKLITVETERVSENLSLGTSVKDYGDYRNQVGQIQGLRKALDLCEDAQTIIAKQGI